MLSSRTAACGGDARGCRWNGRSDGRVVAGTRRTAATVSVAASPTAVSTAWATAWARVRQDGQQAEAQGTCAQGTDVHARQ